MKRLLLLVTILLTIAPVTVNAECIDWGKLMTKYDADHLETWKRPILLETFEDFTKHPGDSWLSYGIPYLIADFLNTADGVNALFGPLAKYSSMAVKPSYTISGMFQRIEKKLRIFIKLSKEGHLTKQMQLDIAYPQNKQIFDIIGSAVLELLAEISPPYDKDKFSAVKNATPIVPAFENFIRGLISYWSFDVNQMDVALAWFGESKKTDINYLKAYNGFINTYFFLAMYNKKNKIAFGTYFEKIEKEISEMKRFSKRLPPPARPRRVVIKTDEELSPLTNRFLLGNSSFSAGLSAAGEKRWMEAAKYFEDALFYTPEDAIMWSYLSQMREKSGDKHKSKEALKKGLELNKCLQ